MENIVRNRQVGLGVSGLMAFVLTLIANGPGTSQDSRPLRELDIEAPHGTFTKTFVVSDLTVTTRNLPGGFSFFGSVYNIPNNKYGYPGSEELRQNIICQNGRTFQAGLKYSFDMGGDGGS